MIGAISRAVATVIVFPYIRAKVIIMSRKTGDGGGGGGSAASASIFSSLVTILKDDGVSALFQVMFCKFWTAIECQRSSRGFIFCTLGEIFYARLVGSRVKREGESAFFSFHRTAVFCSTAVEWIFRGSSLCRRCH